MRKRQESMRRIVEIKRQQCRLAELEVARLAREEQELRDDQQRLVSALNADQPLHGLFVDTMARHLRLLSEKLAALEATRAERQRHLQTQTAQLRQAERILADLRRKDDRNGENRMLAEIIDAANARQAASLP